MITSINKHVVICDSLLSIRLSSHRSIRYTVYGIRYSLFAIRYTLYGHGGSHKVARVSYFNSISPQHTTHNSCHIRTGSVADLRGGGGLGGLNPPPPLGLPSKNLMCIEKRHHYVQTHTVCSYSTLSQAQPQTIGFNPPPPPPPWAAKCMNM